jgi:hypothetical protein
VHCVWMCPSLDVVRLVQLSFQHDGVYTRRLQTLSLPHIIDDDEVVVDRR